MPLVQSERYFASTAVFLSEIIKFSFFLSMALYEIATSAQTHEFTTIGELTTLLSRAVFTGDGWALALPAILYSLQNTLQYFAASNLDAATFSVTYQLKLVSTAMFGIFFLGKVLSARQWTSLGMLAAGVIIVQIGAVSQQGSPLSMKDLRDGVSFNSPRSIWELRDAGNAAAGQLNKRSATYEGIDEDVANANPRMNITLGLVAAVIACILSGIAGVYFERILKARESSKVSIWVRNVQLSFYSLWPLLFLGVLFMDGEHLQKTGFFTGYNWVVWLVVVLQAAGGILVALALEHSDSLTKSSVTSVATLITLVVSALVLEFPSSLLVSIAMHCRAQREALTNYEQFLLGTIITLAASFSHLSASDEKKLRPPPINVSSYEKDGGNPGYFDLEAVATAGKSPLRDVTKDALSTSRPGTPVSERRHYRVKSTEKRFGKREL